MQPRLIPLIIAVGLLSAGCAAIDAINPFAKSGATMQPLTVITPTVATRALWTANAGKAGDYTFAPAVVGDAIFVASQDGTIRRLEGGKTLWKISTGHALSAGVAANDRLVVVGTPKGDVMAYAAADGKALWQTKVTSEVLASPVIGDEGIAVRSGDNRVSLLDASDGGRKWTYQRAMPTLSIRGAGSPVFADRYLFVGFPGGRLVALSLQNGAPAWEGPVAQPRGATELDRVADVVVPPAVDGRQICAVAFQGRVACFDMGQGGALVWSREMSSTSGLVLDGRYLFVTDDKGAVHALDRLTGSSLWKQDKLLNRRVSGPAVRGALVAVADGEGYVHFLSREDGSFVGRQKTDGTPVRSPVRLLGSNFVVQTAGGDVSVIEAQ